MDDVNEDYDEEEEEGAGGGGEVKLSFLLLDILIVRQVQMLEY
jgi:hypothetical protein